MDEDVATVKKENLARKLRDLGSLIIAFSGGVDSTFLLAVAHEVLGERMMAATSNSIIHPVREIESACNFASERGIHHMVFRSEEMSLADFVSNGADRCYHCKRHLFDRILKIAGENGIKHVAHGTNVDDLKDYRPGFRAANETGVIAPLIEARLKKEEVRFLSEEMGLLTWNKPPMACLATRIPYGRPITEKKLKMVEQAETFLSEYGLGGGRVRHHGSMARIEVGRAGLRDIIDEGLREAIVSKFRNIGFAHVALDLEGYKPGKMNRALERESE